MLCKEEGKQKKKKKKGVAANYLQASDAARSLLDSFLFFMFYEWFRSIRLAASHRRRRGRGGLGALEELAIGVAAGACSRALTAPIAHVVTRKQTASMVAGADERRGVGDIARGIKNEKGVKGLWAGFSASLILTLNPSITFFLQDFLRKKAVSKQRSEHPGAFLTFLLAASSKAVASAITYPFQTAKARMQSGILEAEEEEDLIMLEDRDVDREVESKLKAARAARKAARRSIFGTLTYIARTEGVGSLYDGLQGELLKGFLGHGTTMVAKDVMHKLLFKLYFLVATLLSEFRLRRRNRSRSRKAKPTKMAAAVPVQEFVPIDEPLLAVEKAKPADKPRPAPIELPPKMIEQAKPMEPPTPPHRPLFEQARLRRSDFEHSPSSSPSPSPSPSSTPHRPTFEQQQQQQQASSQRPEFEALRRLPAFEDPRSPFEARSPFERQRSPFVDEPRSSRRFGHHHHEGTPNGGGGGGAMDQQGAVLPPLPPALQYRMDVPEVSRRRQQQHVRTKTPVIMNMVNRSHREID